MTHWRLGIALALGLCSWDAAWADDDNWWGGFSAVGTPDGPVYRLFVYDGDLIAAGEFRNFGSVELGRTPARNIVRWDGEAWHPLGAGLGTADESQGWVEDLILYQGDLVAGGPYLGAGDKADVNFIARWNGEEWSGFGRGLDGRVTAMVVQGPNLIAGGTFAAAPPRETLRVARWNGTDWFPMGQGIGPGQVNALTLYEGNVVAGGVFGEAGGGVTAASVAIYDGTEWVQMGGGFEGTLSLPASVFDFIEYQGSLYATGHFLESAGERMKGFARWDGAAWVGVEDSGLSHPDNEFFAFDLEEYEGELYVGGKFHSVGQVPVRYIGRWDGSQWQSLGSGTDAWVRSMVTYDDALFVAGDFRTTGGVESHFIGRWKIDSVPNAVSRLQVVRTSQGNLLRWQLADAVDGPIEVLRQANTLVPIARLPRGTEEFLDRNAPREATAYWLRYGSQGNLAGPVKAEAVAPLEFSVLESNRPNPFNPSTVVSFELARAGRVRLRVFNARGERVRTLIDADRELGHHEVVWDGRDAAGREVGSGVYFVELAAPDVARRIKTTLVR